MVDNTNATYTPAAEWKNKVEVDGSPLDLPSGNTALVKQISPQAFMSQGLIPDPLTAIVKQAINSKQGLPPSAVTKIADNPEQLNAAMEMFDRVLAYVMVAPTVLMPPACQECGEYYNVDDRHKIRTREDYHPYQEAVREDNVLYADQVDMDDKMFIFNWCLGGTRDLQKFRDQQQAGVAAVPDSKVVRGAAKRTGKRT